MVEVSKMPVYGNSASDAAKRKASDEAEALRQVRALPSWAAEAQELVEREGEPPLCGCGTHYVGATCPGNPKRNAVGELVRLFNVEARFPGLVTSVHWSQWHPDLGAAESALHAALVNEYGREPSYMVVWPAGKEA